MDKRNIQKNRKIISINGENRRIKARKFLEQTERLLSLFHICPIGSLDSYTHLLRFEISLKEIMVYYIGKYERTHFFNNQ